MSTLKPAIFSFFADSGFLDLGFENVGYEVVFVNEFHPPFMDAYQHSRAVMNKPKPRFGYAEKSIEDVDHQQLKDVIKVLRKEKRKIGLIGGSPCPDLSIAGKNRGRDGENGRLSQRYIDIIVEMNPDFFLFENVKGLYRT